jgi:hypothetical protein
VSDSEKREARELDAQVAEKLMGHEWFVSSETGRRAIFALGAQPKWFVARADGSEQLAAFWDHCPHYSTDIAAAWLVVDGMARRGFHARLKTPFTPSDLCFAGFTPHGSTGWNGRGDYEASAESMPLAICRAALLYAEHYPALPPLIAEARAAFASEPVR